MASEDHPSPEDLNDIEWQDMTIVAYAGVDDNGEVGLSYVSPQSMEDYPDAVDPHGDALATASALRYLARLMEDQVLTHVQAGGERGRKR